MITLYIKSKKTEVQRSSVYKRHMASKGQNWNSGISLHKALTCFFQDITLFGLCLCFGLCISLSLCFFVSLSLLVLGQNKNSPLLLNFQTRLGRVFSLPNAFFFFFFFWPRNRSLLWDLTAIHYITCCSGRKNKNSWFWRKGIFYIWFLLNRTFFFSLSR